jgi:hypothetical protein
MREVRSAIHQEVLDSSLVAVLVLRGLYVREMWWGRYVLTARSMAKKSRPLRAGRLSCAAG